MLTPMSQQNPLEDSYGGAFDRDRVRTLMTRSNRRGGRRLGGHLAVLLGTGTSIALVPSLWWQVPAMIVHGGVLILLFCGLHETVHRTAFRSRRINDVVAAVLGFLVFVPAAHFRRFHMDHHRFTQDPENDPELLTAKPVSLAAYFWHVLGIPFARAQVEGIVRHAFGHVSAPFVSEADRPTVIREARIHAALYALIAVAVFAGWSTVLVYWVVPAIFGQPFLRLVLLAEHSGCALDPNMHVNTRTTLTNPFVRFVMWNMPYHIEHHVYPGVPFHALPCAHRDMKGGLGVTAPGYLDFHRRYIRALLAGQGQAFVNSN